MVRGEEAYFEELLVADAAVEHLLDEDLLVGVLVLHGHRGGPYVLEEVVGVGVERLNDRVEGLYAFDATVNQL